MVGILAVVLGASPFVVVDGGYLSQPTVPIPHRTIEVFAPALPSRPLLLSDGDAPLTKLQLLIESSPAPVVDDAGVLTYADVTLAIPDALTVRIERAGSLTIHPFQPLTRNDGSRYFVDLPRASWELKPSAPFTVMSNGDLRTEGPVASVELQLQVTGPLFPWPVTGGYQSWGASLAWDAARARLTRFGGGDAFEFEEGTSIWDPMAGWQVLPITSPPPRVRASLVYDSMRQRLVLFGGQGANGRLADTWEFDGAQWVQMAPATSPAPRWSHGAAYDETSHTMIMFGGLLGSDSSNQELDDTWSWDGVTWTRLTPPTSPSARDAFGMAWDGTRRRVTLVAGWDGSNLLGDAWAWEGGTWQPLPPLPASGRASTALAWSPLSGNLVLVGGWDPRGGPFFHNDVWRFNGTSWSAGQPLPVPAARMALASHPTMGVVMLGGRNLDGFTADTVRLEPTWQRLPQGDRVERGVTLGLTLAGERYLWRPSIVQFPRLGPLRAYWHIPRGRQVTGLVNGTGLSVYGVADGGSWGWDTDYGFQLVPPPPFRFIGGDPDQNYVLDLDGGLHLYQAQSWRFIASAPAGLRAITPLPFQRVPEYFVWTDRLYRWSPFDGGLAPFGVALDLDGGVILTATESLAIATEARGSWHMTPPGNWFFMPLPRLAEPPIHYVVISDAGLSEYEFMKPIGARCERREDCAGGVCISGRCCEASCSGTCEVCSAAAGAPADGVCGRALDGTACIQPSGSAGVCRGGFLCTEPIVMAGSDAGFDAGEWVDPTTPPDAGRPRRDAGPIVIEEPAPPPPGCGCSGVPGAEVLLAAFWAASRGRRRLRSASPRPPFRPEAWARR